MTKATTGLLDFLSKHAVILPEETIEIPEWEGRSITLRGFSSRERDLFEEDSLRRANAKAGNGAKRGASVQADLTNFRARLVSRHIVEDGMRTFANARGEELLGDQPAAVLDRLFSVSQRLSGFSPEDVEALTKNSEMTADEDSSSSSQEPSDGPSVN
jgi:hypothetical protein